jgi:hypothetical protein
MVYSFKVGPYARSIYLYGSLRFSDIPVEYYQPVKQYAATKFQLDQINQALALNYISQQEYDETILLLPEIPVVYSVTK